MDWFYLYFVGFLVLIAAVGMGMHQLGIGSTWIFIVCLGLFGIAVMKAVTHTRGDEDAGGEG